MRTTLDIDDDLAEALSDLARARARSLSRVVNDLIRAGLQSEREAAREAPYEPVVFQSGSARVDVTDIAAALEILGAAR